MDILYCILFAVFALLLLVWFAVRTPKDRRRNINDMVDSDVSCAASWAISDALIDSLDDDDHCHDHCHDHCDFDIDDFDCD